MGATLVRRVWKAIGAVDGFAEGASIFSEDDADRAYFVNGTQVAELHGNGLGLRLTRKVISANRARLKADERIDLRRSGSDWLVLTLEGKDVVDVAVELAELAAAAHRPPPGTTVKPPPTGVDLARRRRFH